MEHDTLKQSLTEGFAHSMGQIPAESSPAAAAVEAALAAVAVTAASASEKKEAYLALEKLARSIQHSRERLEKIEREDERQISLDTREVSQECNIVEWMRGIGDILWPCTAEQETASKPILRSLEELPVAVKEVFHSGFFPLLCLCALSSCVFSMLNSLLFELT